MMDPSTMDRALELLGKTLQARQVRLELVVIGGGALMLEGIIQRPSDDLDVVARREGDAWVSAEPFPEPVQRAVREVGQALGLSVAPTHEKDWLNAGPDVLRRRGMLPAGFFERLSTRSFDALTVHVASRIDLIHLKLLAATAADRGRRTHVDVQDLKQLAPSREELLSAARWVRDLDGRLDVVEVDLMPVLRRLREDVHADDL